MTAEECVANARADLATPDGSAGASPHHVIILRKPRKRAAGPRVVKAKKPIDPAIAELRREHAAKVAAYRTTQESKKLLETCLKRLERMTELHRMALSDRLAEMVTPKLL